MKRLFIATLLAVGTMAAQAQSKNDTLEIGQTAYRITYKSKSVRDTSVTPYKYRDDEMRLDISESGLSKFYSYSRILQQEFIQKQHNMGSYDLREMPKAGNLTWIFYKSYPAEGKTMMLDAVGNTDCQIEEGTETPEWSIVPDSTAELLGYPCQLAVTQFKGRQWYAWYSEDIPLDEGPWKLRGLPGLILKAYDSQRQFIFDGAGMEQVTEPITFVKKKREKVSMKDFKKLRANYDPNDAIKAYGGQVIIYNSDGTKIDKIQKSKYNLIEQ